MTDLERTELAVRRALAQLKERNLAPSGWPALEVMADTLWKMNLELHRGEGSDDLIARMQAEQAERRRQG